MSEDNKIDILNGEHMDIARKFIKKHEGRENKVYKDTEGHLTTGIGYKLPKDSPLKENEYVSNEFVDNKFEETFMSAAQGAKRILKGVPIKPEAFAYLTALVFQMGTTEISSWSNTLGALKDGDYMKASNEMLKGRAEGTASKWSLQTPRRAFDTASEVAKLSDKE